MNRQTKSPEIKSSEKEVIRPDNEATSGILTVIVVDNKSQRAQGANVTISPSGATGQTDSNGEIQFKLGEASRYDVTVVNENNTVTVPYYVTSEGSTRLMVNPTYVKTAEAYAQKVQSPLYFFTSHAGTIFGVIGGLVLVFFVYKKYKNIFSRKKRVVFNNPDEATPRRGKRAV